MRLPLLISYIHGIFDQMKLEAYVHDSTVEKDFLTAVYCKVLLRWQSLHLIYIKNQGQAYLSL